MTLLTALAALQGPAGATTLERLSPPEQIAQAEAIFVGTVVDIDVRSSADANTPYTFVTFSVSEALKGEVPPDLMLRMLVEPPRLRRSRWSASPSSCAATSTSFSRRGTDAMHARSSGGRRVSCASCRRSGPIRGPSTTPRAEWSGVSTTRSG